MNDHFISQNYLCGKSRRELVDLVVSVGVLKSIDKNRWACEVKLAGYLNENYDAQASSAINALNAGLSYLRQTLSASLEKNSQLKFYEDRNGEVIERSVEDICLTHDCISEELEDMVNWAQSLGAKKL